MVGVYAVLFSAVILGHVLGLYVAYWRIGPRHLVGLGYYTQRPCASPDGRALAFVGVFEAPLTEDYIPQCCVVDMGTGELRILADPSWNIMPVLFPPWSADGRFFLCDGYDHFLLRLVAPLHELKLMKEEYPSASTARILDMRTGNSHELPQSVARYAVVARWLDGANLLVFAHAFRPWVYNAEDRTLRPVKLLGRHQECSAGVLKLRTKRIALRLAKEDGPWGPLFLYDRQSGAWVPHPLPDGAYVAQMSDDGRHVVLWRQRGERTDPLARVEYELADLAGGTRRLIGGMSYDDWPEGGMRFRFSPSGRWLVCTEWPRDAKTRSGLRLYDLVTGQDKTIAKGRTPEERRFSPSGRWLLFDEKTPDPASDERVWAYDLATEELTKVVEGRSLRGVRSTADDTKLVWGVEDERPALRILDLAKDRSWNLRLDLREDGRVAAWDYAVLAEGVVFLVRGRRGLEVYRIGWDGTGQERIYPRDGD